MPVAEADLHDPFASAPAASKPPIVLPRTAGELMARPLDASDAKLVEASDDEIMAAKLRLADLCLALRQAEEEVRARENVRNSLVRALSLKYLSESDGSGAWVYDPGRRAFQMKR